MLEIHRFPLKLRKVITEIMKNWNTILIVPLEEVQFESEPIFITNGLFQGDVMSADCFKLSLNPVSWELRRSEGYTISKPIKEKITHSFFIDDLKAYAKTLAELIKLMSKIKEKMEDAGLEWNAKKTNILNIVRGVIDTSVLEVCLLDGTKIKCLSAEDLYKFLGVPENIVHDVGDIVETFRKVVKQRTNVIWSSPLSDFNKVAATNSFVHSSLEYFMWSEKFNIEDIRGIDLIIRNILNERKAKYKLQKNESLYLPRIMGGRGLKNLESTYKRTKVAAAMNLLTNVDPRLRIVCKFEKLRKERGRSSILTDAIRYAKEDFIIDFEPLEHDFVVHYEKDGQKVSTSKKEIVKSTMKKNLTKRMHDELLSATWQGRILKSRTEDTEISFKECFAWLSRWKDAPVEVINDFQSIYLQTIPTLTFRKYRGEPSIVSTTCRLCHNGEESVKHLLSNCGKFVNHAYKRRHDRVLQFIVFKFLNKNGLIAELPPWYTKICIKPCYENNELQLYWDIPEYSGYDTELENGPLRPDGKIINIKKKSILVLEMSVPWIENRKSKLEEKESKYVNIIQGLKVDNPGFEVQQLTFIVDCLGGFSKDLPENLALLDFTKKDIDSILPGIQKIVITEANAVINNFKISTMS